MDDELNQILALSRHVFECTFTDSAFHMLQAAVALSNGRAGTEAILREARYQLAQRDDLQWEGAINVTRIDYVRLMHKAQKQLEDLEATLGREVL